LSIDASPFLHERPGDSSVSRRSHRFWVGGKGLQRVRTDGDLGIAAHVATEQAQTLPTFYNGVAGGWRWLSGFEATTPAQVYDVGTLVVDIFDRQTRNVMWRGCSPKALSVKPGKSASKLSAAISQMFRNFPPPSLTPDTAVIR
jgi:hypothetical protein